MSGNPALLSSHIKMRGCLFLETSEQGIKKEGRAACPAARPSFIRKLRRGNEYNRFTILIFEVF